MCPDFLLRLLCENLNVVPQDLGRKNEDEESESALPSTKHQVKVICTNQGIEMKVTYSFVCQNLK